MTGRIHSLNERGFGFIAVDGDPSREGRHFFHCRSLQGTNIESLRAGDRVEFTSTQTPRGLEAINVTTLES